ncbi:plasmid stabilization protein [Clostridium gasigenes]|uniref:plasmid stabilization protein n=1 Tax=Clostridium gasigenes TaxID=94869 RepID=UPI001C0E68D1|nr:plasmid stabilization protein [Clostridium gasigenes]
MEKEILEILKEMQVSIKSLDEGQKEIKLDLKEINKKLEGVVEQTADLTEFRTTVLSKLEDLKVVEEVTKVNCYDIAKLKAVK